MIESSPPCPRRLGLVLAPRAGASAVGAAALLGLALLASGLRSASAQQPPPAGGPAVPGSPAMGGLGPEAQAKEEPPTPAERLIDDAKERLAKLQSCAADLEERVDLLNQHFLLKGRYLKAPQFRVYFRLALAGLADTNGTALQVCDGETLWDFQQVLDQQVYHKFSVKPVMERLNSPELEARMRDQFKEALGFAGPETLLTGLRRQFRFEQEKEEGKVRDKVVWILRGRWKDRRGLIGPNQQPVNPIGMLPPYIPALVVLYLGKDDGWPYKVEFLGQKPTELLDTRKIGPDGRPIGSRSSIESIDPTKVVLEYSDVRINPNLNIDEFAFQAPPNASVDDGTELLVTQLDRAIAAQAERKKAETTKQQGPVLDQSLDIPPPPPAASPSAGQPSTP